MEKKLSEYLNKLPHEKDFHGSYCKIFLTTIDGEKMIIKQSRHKEYYENEKNFLIKMQHLEECFPQLKYYDNNSKTLIMKYVGENIANIFKKNPEFNLADYEEKIYECNQKIKRSAFYHNDIKPQNICIDDKGILRFIDFEKCTRILGEFKHNRGPFAYREWECYRPDKKHKENIPILDKKFSMRYWFPKFYK